MKKRILSLILALMLCVGLLPLSVLAEDEAPAQPEADEAIAVVESGEDAVAAPVLEADTPTAPAITTVAVTGITEPVPGQTPDFEGAVPAGANYRITNYRWLDFENHEAYSGNEMTASDTFVDGHKYQIYLTVEPTDGAAFGTFRDMTITLNGEEPGSVYSTSNMADITIVKTYRLEGDRTVYIDSVAVTDVVAPVAGKAAEYTWSIPSDAGYTKTGQAYWIETDAAPTSASDLYGVTWYDAEDDMVFKADKYYTFCAVAKASEGYAVRIETSATMNGEAATLDPYVSGDFDVWYCFGKPTGDTPDAPTEVNTITITGVDEPALNAAATTNGQPTEEGLVRYVNPYSPVDTSCVWKEEGASAWTVPSGTYSFAAGKTYTVRFLIAAEEGYAFADTVTATVNGKVATVENFGDMRYVSYTFAALEEPPVLTEVDTITITGVAEPEAGKAMPFDWELPADSGLVPHNYVWGECAWIVSDQAYSDFNDLWLNGDRFYEGSQFAENFAVGDYATFVAYVTTEEGYAFADSVTGSINGNDVKVRKATDATGEEEIDYCYLWYTFGPLEGTPIDAVTVTGVTAPVAGEEASYDWSVPAGEGYEKNSEDYDGYWIETEEEPADIDDVYAADAEWYYPGDELIFDADKYYTFLGAVAPADGYELADTTTGTVNGETAGVDPFDDVSFDVWYCFGKPAADDPVPQTYAVTLPGEPVGYSVSPVDGSVSPVTEGGSYSFTVTMEDGYEAGEDFAVYANGTKLEERNGVYTIGNIRTEQVVTVEGVVEKASQPTPTPTPTPKPTPTPTPKPGVHAPDTGDENRVFLWLGIMLLAMGGLTAVRVLPVCKKKGRG